MLLSLLDKRISGLKEEHVCIFFQYLRHVLKLLPLQGATAPTHDTQGAALLALGYVLHWAFSPRLLISKLEYVVYSIQPVNLSTC